MTDPSRILILTLCIGADYRRNLQQCLDSKELYAKKHGYTYVLGGEEWWDRDRPFSWSKIPFLLHYLKDAKDKYDYIWMSDADVYITNHDIKIEDHIIPLLPKDKDLLMTFDSCRHLNAGNIIFRPTDWAIDFLERAYTKTEFLYDIWWENAAMCHLFGMDVDDLKRTMLTYETFNKDYMSIDDNEDKRHLEVTPLHYKFNAYIQGWPEERLWEQGDFLVHFAGFYDSIRINSCVKQIVDGNVPRSDMFGR